MAKVVSKEERKRQLETLSQTKDGCLKIVWTYARCIGKSPVKQYVRQEMIPAILAAEFPEPVATAQKKAKTAR
jgi:hypothetical protein